MHSVAVGEGVTHTLGQQEPQAAANMTNQNERREGQVPFAPKLLRAFCARVGGEHWTAATLPVARPVLDPVGLRDMLEITVVNQRSLHSTAPDHKIIKPLRLYI